MVLTTLSSFLLPALFASRHPDEPEPAGHDRSCNQSLLPDP